MQLALSLLSLLILQLYLPHLLPLLQSVSLLATKSLLTLSLSLPLCQTGLVHLLTPPQQLLAGLDSGRHTPAPRRPVFPLGRSCPAGPVRRPPAPLQGPAGRLPGHTHHGPGSECQHLCGPPADAQSTTSDGLGKVHAAAAAGGSLLEPPGQGRRVTAARR